MSSLYVVGYGNVNLQNYINFFQTKLRIFIKQNNVCFYNLKTLWKAEASAERLKRNAHFILPTDKDATCEYWGFIDERDWGSLYSKLFSPVETDKSGYYQPHSYFSSSYLKSFLRQFEQSPYENNSRTSPYDFRIVYHNEVIHNSDRICIIRIDINSISSDDYEFFHLIVSELDNLFPDMFLSAYIDDYYNQNFDFKFDSQMLTEKILNTGKAFYVSQKLMSIYNITDTDIFQHYNISHMINGSWFMLVDSDKRSIRDTAQMNDLLIPHYMLVSWSNLSMQKYLCVDYFDTISVYYNKNLPTDPTLILSRGYSPKQLDCLAKEYGEADFQVRYTKKDFLADS